MKTLTIDMRTWRAEIEVSDDATWGQVFNLVSDAIGFDIHDFSLSGPRFKRAEFKSLNSTRMAQVDDGDHVSVQWPDHIIPLHEAARNGNVEAIQRWMVSGADINVPNEDAITPLILASRELHEGCVAEMLRLGADVHRVDNLGWTALHWVTTYADSKGDAGEVVRLLVAAGCDAAVRSNSGRTAVELARIFNGPEWAVKFEKWVADASLD